MFWFLLACHKSSGSLKVGPGPTVADYAGDVATLLLFAPLGDPEGTPRMLRISEADWEFRAGDFWRKADPGTPLVYTMDTDLVVDGQTLLPEEVRVGGAAESATIIESGVYEGYYGTFPDTVTVEIKEGPWTGTAIFARDIGLIRYSNDGDWELTYYERNSEDTVLIDTGPVDTGL